MLYRLHDRLTREIFREILLREILWLRQADLDAI